MPGCTSYTKMPSPASRSAYSLVSIDMPALLTQYSARLGEETVEEKLEIFTITPRRPSVASCLIIARATACVMNIVPIRLMPSTYSNDSSVVSRMSRRTLGATPALLTSTSMRPKRETTSFTNVSRSLASAMEP